MTRYLNTDDMHAASEAAHNKRDVQLMKPPPPPPLNGDGLKTEYARNGRQRSVDSTGSVQVIRINESDDHFTTVKDFGVHGGGGGGGEDDEDEEDSDIISAYIGHYGWWQFFWTFVLCLFQLPPTFHIFAFVFQSATKDFWCARPEGMETMDVTLWRNMTQPQGPCHMYDVGTFDMLAATFDTHFAANHRDTTNMSMSSCGQFEYDNSEMGGTLVSEWNLVCDRKSLLSVVEMCFLAGAAVGSIASGYISDKFGRKVTLMSFITIQTLGGTALAYAETLLIFMALRFIIGFASMAVTVVSFVLVVEIVSGKWRTIIGILNILPVAIAYIIIAVIAYYTRDWRQMQLVISVPWFSLLIFWFFLPESPRWLLATGRIDQLQSVIEQAAKWNNRELPADYEQTLVPPPHKKGDTSIMNLVSPEYRRTTLLMVVVWFSFVLLYFGITLHLSNLGGDIYLNTIIAGSVEAVSILLSVIVVLKLGIKINLVIYMLVAGVACLLVNFVPAGNLGGIITLAMIGKCTTGANNAIIPTFTAVQYPTTMRNLGVGVGNFAAGVALIVVPYLWLLEHYYTYLPMTIMGVFGIIGAIGLVLLKDRATEIRKQKELATRYAETMEKF